jgi:hypothetical protein
MGGEEPKDFRQFVRVRGERPGFKAQPAAGRTR